MTANKGEIVKQMEVLHEEVVTHVDVVRRINGWRGEARVMGNVKIGNRFYEFNQVVSLRLKNSDED